DPSIAQLSPRLRQVLRCLLEGDSELQVARRLELSSETVHQYVKSLYRHFGVNTRAELLAYFLRRSGLRLDLLCDSPGTAPYSLLPHLLANTRVGSNVLGGDLRHSTARATRLSEGMS